MRTQVTIIGYGTMGKAIAAALQREKEVRIFTVGRHTSDARAVKEIQASDYVVISVKPQDAPEALGRTKGRISAKTTLVSIMAGVPLKKLASLAGHKKIIRMMPNLGLAHGEGIAVWKSTGLNKAEAGRAKKFLDLITENFEVKNEDAVNRATAISGSGPAYFFLLAESLSRAARSLGFSAEESHHLVSKTLSAAAMLGREGDYAELINKVASKGGTTQAALKVFQKKRFISIVDQAARAAYKRAREFSK